MNEKKDEYIKELKSRTDIFCKILWTTYPTYHKSEIKSTWRRQPYKRNF